MSRIEVRHLRKTFTEFVAVDDVSFSAQEGELVALLGPSGSGKSTILRIIAGLEIPDSGEIFLDGTNVSSQVSQKRRVGFVFQHYALFKHMTVEKNIAFGLEILKRDSGVIEEKVRELIQLVNLKGYEHHYPAQLSGGQRQRVALARALAPEPKILLLDEPFGSLDAKVRDNLASWIRDLHHRINMTSVFVTHDQNEAIKIADKIVLINRGQIEQIGSALDVYDNPSSKFVASFIGSTNVLTGARTNGIIHIGDMPLPVKTEVDATDDDNEVVLLVRPEDILLNSKKTKKHSIPAQVQNFYYRGNSYDIKISLAGQTLSVLQAKNEQPLNWYQNQTVYVGFFKYTIFAAPEGKMKVKEKLSQLGYIE